MPFQKELTFYHPTQSKTGAAMSINYFGGSVWFKFARQSDEKRFDWKNKVMVKIGIGDITQLLEFIEGSRPQLKLFHRSIKGDTILNADKSTKVASGYVLSLTRKPKEGEETKVFMGLSRGEMLLLREALIRGTLLSLNWSNDNIDDRRPHVEESEKEEETSEVVQPAF